MGMLERGYVTVPACDCCGAIGPAGATAFLANYKAEKQGWDVPGVTRDGDPEEGYVRCPLCVASNVWPHECCVPEWHGGPTIRLATTWFQARCPRDR